MLNVKLGNTMKTITMNVEETQMYRNHTIRLRKECNVGYCFWIYYDGRLVYCTKSFKDESEISVKLGQVYVDIDYAIRKDELLDELRDVWEKLEDLTTIEVEDHKLKYMHHRIHSIEFNGNRYERFTGILIKTNKDL